MGLRSVIGLSLILLIVDFQQIIEAGFEGQRLRGRVRVTGTTNVAASDSLWLAPNPSKRWGELFFLLYTPFWLTLCFGIIVPYMLYQSFTELEFLLLGLFAAAPTFLIPLVFVGKVDRNKCLTDRYWLKANIWIIIFSYVGNYFWTHYSFNLLGASYTYPSWKMNNVPHIAFLLTHTRFLFYHMVSNLTLRRLSHSIADLPKQIQFISKTAWILAFSFFIAYLEILAVSNFPYYDFVDRESMDKIGSIFYAIYFVVSLPLFSRVAENEGDTWDLSRVAVDALGAAMLVTIILDLCRLFLVPIVPFLQAYHCSQPCFQASKSHMSNGGI